MEKLNFKDLPYEEAAVAYNRYECLLPGEDKFALFTMSAENGTGEFRWFGSITELKDFFLNVWVPSLTRQRDEAYYTFIRGVQLTLRLCGNDLKYVRLLSQSNAWNDLQVKWAGSFDKLMHGLHPFVREVQEAFNKKHPGKEEDTEEFLNFLRSYYWDRR